MPTTSPRWPALIWPHSRQGDVAAWDRPARVRRHRIAAAPVYGHAKQGASFRHAKIAGRALLRGHRAVMVRGDSAFGTKTAITTCLDAGVEFSPSVAPNKRINAAIAAIDEYAWTPVHYPGAIEDPDTAALISDAEVAETLHAARCTAPHAHRAAGGAPSQRRPLPRRPVPGMGGTTPLLPTRRCQPLNPT